MFASAACAGSAGIFRRSPDFQHHSLEALETVDLLEIQKAQGRARRRGGNTWGALRALSLSMALPIGELSIDLLSLRSVFMNSTAVDPDEPACSPVFLLTRSLELNQPEGALRSPDDSRTHLACLSVSRRLHCQRHQGSRLAPQQPDAPQPLLDGIAALARLSLRSAVD